MDVLGFFVILVGLVFGIVGLVLGATVEKRGAGFFLGLLLGPVGWIIVLLLPRDQESKEISTAQKTEPKKRTDRPERNLESTTSRKMSFLKNTSSTGTYLNLLVKLFQARIKRIVNAKRRKKLITRRKLITRKSGDVEQKKKRQNRRRGGFLSLFLLQL